MRGGLTRLLLARALLVLSSCFLSAVPAQALGQQRAVYPDDSVTARDALTRVRELHASGNTGEAVRVLQGTLDSEAEKMLPAISSEAQAGTEAADLLYPVRAHVTGLLLAVPELLRAYREQIEPAAAALLAAGELVRVERSMFCTPSGFEATLRLAQLALEEANFESARLYLEQLEQHPERQEKSTGAAEAAGLARLLATYIPREEITRLAARWSVEAGLKESTLGQKRRAFPALALMRSVNSADDQLPPSELPSVPQPLQSAALEPLGMGRSDGGARGGVASEESPFAMGQRGASGSAGSSGGSSWIFPTFYGNAIYISDGLRVGAWDSATLAPIWTMQPTGRSLSQLYNVDELFQYGMSSNRAGVEDSSTVTVGSGIAVMVGGVAYNNGRVGDNNVYGFDALTGRRLWAMDVGAIDIRAGAAVDRQAAASVRGNAVIDGGTVVLALRRGGQTRRISSLYLVGLDLRSGQVRWTRLVGSFGTNAWGRGSTRPEGLLLSQGVVYRSDDMGVSGAYEAATGRPVWVRLSPTKSMFTFGSPNEESPSPFTMHRPIAVGNDVVIIEPKVLNEPGRVIRVDARTGVVTAARDGSALNGPDYLLLVGDYIAAVGSTRVAFVRASMLGDGTVRLSDSYATNRIVGRGVSAGDRLLLPLADALITIDPADPSASTRLPIAMSGNIVVAGGGESLDGAPGPQITGGRGTHVVIADNQGVHSYLGWSSAQRLLTERIAMAPLDPSPILTYIDLCTRVGKAQTAPELADRALSLVEKMTDTTEASVQRGRLFDILAEAILSGRKALAEVADGEPAQVSGYGRVAITDLNLLDEMLLRLERAAGGPEQRVQVAFERAWLRISQKRFADAVEAYQSVLLERVLAEQPVSADLVLSGVGSSLPSAVQPAGDLAKASLIELLTLQGPGVYAAFDEEATREAGQLRPDGPGVAAAYAALADRYPVAAVTPELWRSAGVALALAGDVPGARTAFGAGVSAAELSAIIGREDQSATLSRLASDLCGVFTGVNDTEPLYHLMMRLASDYPSTILTLQSGSVAPADYGQRLEAQLATRTELPRLGSVEAMNSSGAGRAAQGGASAARENPAVQALAGWDPMLPICKRLPGTPYGSLVMINRSLSRIGYWATDALDGRLHLVWSRKFEAAPAVVSLSPATSVLFWPTSSGGYLESIRNSGGKRQVGVVKWKSQDFASIFPPAQLSENPVSLTDRFNTPTDGKVRQDDMLVLAGGEKIMLVQRRGVVAAFSAESGKVEWSQSLDVVRVFEAEIAGAHLLVAGTYLNKSDGRYAALVVSHALVDGAKGASLTATQLGDHPRWLRATGKGDCLVAGSEMLLRFDPATGAVAWMVLQADAVKSSLGAWVVGDTAFVLGSGPRLWGVRLADGEFLEAPVNTRDHISFPMAATVHDRALYVTGGEGFAVIDERGALIGVDALESSIGLIAPQPSESYIFAVENQTLLGGGDDPAADTARLFCFEKPTGRLISTRRVRLYDAPQSLILMDGKIMIATPTVTLIIDSP